MTVVVKHVLPNGNLVIEGYRKRVVAGEDRMLRVRGVVRPIDIAVNNVVQSQFIANLEIIYTGKGVESAYASPNWWGLIYEQALAFLTF